MSRDGYSGPKLPKVLLSQVQNTTSFSNGRRDVSRKDRRKAERQEKKNQPVHRQLVKRNHSTPRQAPNPRTASDGPIKHDRPVSATSNEAKPNTEAVKLPKSILKKRTPEKAPAAPSHEDKFESRSEDEPPRVSRGVKRKLEEDDAEVAALEKKLGIKGKKSKALELDGLDWIVGGSDGDGEHTPGRTSKPSKTAKDVEWLEKKRAKATGVPATVVRQDVGSDEESQDLSDEDFRSDSDEDELEVDDDFGDFDSGEDAGSDDGHQTLPSKTPRQRENPYIAPVSATSTAKYIPPSRRDKSSTNDDESLKQIRRQIQGLLNRLSDANISSIVKSLEDIYAQRPRQHVTSTLIDLLIGLISDPSTLNDTFLILHAAFATAMYKHLGPDFGAQLLEKLVETFSYHHGNGLASGKQTLNLIAFLSYLYTFQLVGSHLVFDYIRLLLNDFSENTTELLLRVIRTSGQQLRQDDPSALKDIVLLLHKSVKEEDNISVRTKFMIETIDNLKNNRMKQGVAASVLASEHTSKMKKLLSSLNSNSSQSFKASEPLRLTLADIQNADKRGKWWLIGASYMDPHKASTTNASATLTSVSSHDDAGYESETPGSTNLHRLARTQGMNTEVRRAIFITLLSSGDYQEARERLVKLHLKAKQQLEIPRVLVHCVGAEEAYNPFYELVARQFCKEHAIRKAFQFAIWDKMREMEEADEDEEGVEEDEEERSMKKSMNLAKFCGVLTANAGMDVRVLKKVDFASLSSRSRQSLFVEVFLTTLLVQCRKSHREAASEGYEDAIKTVFARAADVSGLAAGLCMFVEQVLAKAHLASKRKEKDAVKQGGDIAVEVLREGIRRGPLAADESD